MIINEKVKHHLKFLLNVMFFNWHNKLIYYFFLDRYLHLIRLEGNKNHLKRYIRNSLRQDLLKRSKILGKCRNIWNIYSKNDLATFQVDKIKSENNFYSPFVYDVSLPGKIPLKKVEINIFEFPLATIVSGSDVVRLKNKMCYWFKSDNYLNFKNKFFDLDIINYNECEKKLCLIPLESSKFIEGDCLSLIGSKDFSFGHFLVEYFPKLIFAVERFADRKVTVLATTSLDKDTLEMILFVLPDTWSFTFVDISESVLCENLIYIDNCSWITDHSETMVIGDTQIYEETALALQRFVKDYKDLKGIRPEEKNKVYLPRPGLKRTITNGGDVDLLMNELGFVKTECKGLSLEEKVKTFTNASVIVGPGGSAFSNIIYCDGETDIYCIVNKNRLYDPYLSILSRVLALKLIFIPSTTIEDYADLHSSYTIETSLIRELVVEKTIDCQKLDC